MRSFTLRLLFVGFLVFAAAALTARPRAAGAHGAFAAGAAETRCGWFSNPTPANASLHDREAEWIIGVQGGHQADGDWPEFGPKQWVETNVHYGYGCACLTVEVDRESGKVLKINSARARPLSACRRDRALKRWGFK
ncbi:MAG TPA: DUF4087 domain-containing protein [Pyrinomonadaceae bacterium]|nr:DUF4087 domain-containing protein [Pyrinomonadaceae bacterium]